MPFPFRASFILLCAVFAATSCAQIFGIDPGHLEGSGGGSTTSTASIGSGAPGGTTSASMLTSTSSASVGAGGSNAGPFLENFSVRASVETGEGITKMQFVVEGSGMKCVLVRGIGKDLLAEGVPAPVLADPTIDLSTDATPPVPVAVNNDWKSTQEAVITATGKAPEDNQESAIYACLGPGQYIATLQGVSGGTGTGLLDIYDLDDPSTATSRLTLTAGQGESSSASPLICGFTIQGAPGTSLDIVVTGLGPSLSVATRIADPTLTLYQGSTNIGQNDNWGVPPMNLGTHAPTNASESALAENLTPNPYTAVVAPLGAPGIAKAQIFNDGPP